MSLSTTEFARRVLIVAAVAAVGLLVWRLIDVALLVFAGIILAVSLASLSRLAMRYGRLNRRWALVSVVFILVIGLLGLGTLTGARLATQFGQLREMVENAWAQAHHMKLLARFLDAGARIVPVKSVPHLAAKEAASLADGGAAALLVLVIGLFLAAHPQLYVRGLLRLTPRVARRRTKQSLDALGIALSRWLRGVVVAMVGVGATTMLGLFMLGIPLALPLGILAGVLEFISYVGPFVSAIPAILEALTVGPGHALGVVGLFAVVHLLEAYVMVPLIQKWAVALPPALAVVAVVTFGLLFGLVGIVLAQPLMVCAITLVRELYVRRDIRAA